LLRNEALKTTSRISISAMALVLFAVVLCCFAGQTEQGDRGVIAKAGMEAGTAKALTEKEIETVLKWIAKKDFAKADALKRLRETEPERFTEEEIDRALKWIEKKDEEKAVALKKLWAENPQKFKAEIGEIADAEIRKAWKNQRSDTVRGMIFLTVGGLGLFLFGMGMMSDGLKKVAGRKLKDLLGALTKHRVIAVLIGALTTCLIQSSSATTVMRQSWSGP